MSTGLANDVKLLARIAMQTVKTACEDGGDVSEAFKKGIKKSVEQNVYGVYSPSVYTRRGDGGGLSDKGNLRCSFQNETDLSFEMKIEDWTPGNPDILGSRSWGSDHVSDIVEEGTYGSMWPNPMMGNARPYMEEGADMGEGDADAAAQAILNMF